MPRELNRGAGSLFFQLNWLQKKSSSRRQTSSAPCQRLRQNVGQGLKTIEFMSLASTLLKQLNKRAVVCRKPFLWNVAEKCENNGFATVKASVHWRCRARPAGHFHPSLVRTRRVLWGPVMCPDAGNRNFAWVQQGSGTKQGVLLKHETAKQGNSQWWRIYLSQRQLIAGVGGRGRKNRRGRG